MLFNQYVIKVVTIRKRICKNIINDRMALFTIHKHCAEECQSRRIFNGKKMQSTGRKWDLRNVIQI